MHGIKKINNLEVQNHALKEGKFDSELFNNYCIGKYDLKPTLKVVEKVMGYSPEDQKLLDQYKARVKKYSEKYSLKVVRELRSTFGKYYGNYMEKEPDYPKVERIVLSTNIIKYLMPIEEKYFKEKSGGMYDEHYFYYKTIILTSNVSAR